MKIQYPPPHGERELDYEKYGSLGDENMDLKGCKGSKLDDEDFNSGYIRYDVLTNLDTEIET